jgi:hypothetical protein
MIVSNKQSNGKQINFASQSPGFEAVCRGSDTDTGEGLKDKTKKNDDEYHECAARKQQADYRTWLQFCFFAQGTADLLTYSRVDVG